MRGEVAVPTLTRRNAEKSSARRLWITSMFLEREIKPGG